MRRLLQSIIYNRKVYDRPQDEWTCGRTAEGCPCVFGPSAKGECRATSQCLPAKKGDRWVCTRLISLGAACGPGPMPDGACGCPVPPCRPVRSLTGQRRKLTWLATCATLGVVIYALLGRSELAWTNPGPLTSQHATSAQRCSDCHADRAATGVALGADLDRHAAHDRLCLECHDLGPNARSPHGESAAALVALVREGSREKPRRPLSLVVARPLVHGVATNLTCATCHQEHHGRDFELARLTDQQCQVCHQTQFASFTSGHPEFTNYPYVRRTRVRFDHTAHLTSHFLVAELAARAPKSCSTCHEPAGDGRQMLVRSFEQTCARCHAGQIEGEGRPGPKGVMFFRLPAFDTAALIAAGEPVGEWPLFCEGSLTPFMRWMLEDDETARAALVELGSINPENLAAASPSQKAAAARLLWSVKGLLADLVTQGQRLMLHRLGTSDPTSMARRTGQLPADALLAAQQAWLPNLLTEVAAYRHGQKPPLPPAAAAGPAATNSPTPVTAKSAADDDLLGPGPAAGTPAKPAAADDLLAADASAAPPAVASTSAAPAVSPAPTSTPAMQLDDAELRVAEGGWYRRDESYAVYYRPGGHADPFLTAWLDATVSDASPASRAIFSQLADDQGPGLCTKCHSIDALPDKTVMNWHAARPLPGHREITTFKHSAHFSLMGDQGCKTCHVLDSKAAYASAFGTNRDPAIFHSNFAPITRSECATCHQPGIAGAASCQQCHNYHTGDLQTLRPPASDFERPPKT